MTPEFRPVASFTNGSLRIAFADPRCVSESRDLEVVVDLDEFGDPCGVEMIGMSAALGANAPVLAESLAGEEVRFSYDRESDAAAIGVSVGTGTRVRRSVPRQAVVGLDSAGRLITVAIQI
jgi:uncharacterized protein YuzE